MWLLFAFLSAFFAGTTSVLAKVGIKNISSDFATAFRTVIVLIFSWLMVFVVGSQGDINKITPRSLIFLILSGCATGLSWLFYFRALSMGSVSKVVAVDKSSTFITILFAVIFLGEPFGILTAVGVVLMIVGTVMMLQKGDAKQGEKKSWLFYALLSAIFASLQSILGKIGVENIESNLATAIRTAVVLVFAWAIVFWKKESGDFRVITKKECAFLVLSGVTTGASWLCYYKALQTGRASVVAPVDKLSILFAVLLSWLFLKEKQTKKSIAALFLLLCGTLMLVFA